MEKSLILETTFLIDLEREALKKTEGPAHVFLGDNADYRLYIDFVIAGELASGTSLQDQNHWIEFIRPFFLLNSNRELAWEYGRLFRYLQNNGMMIGCNDLWIAATGLAYQIPVVTRNHDHFKRVPRLEVFDY